MKIDIAISADHIKQEYLKNKVVVVIDMLRATSVIITALSNGAKKVIPLLTVEEAFKEKAELELNEEEVLLGGERKAVKIDGFNLTNSPLEYGKSVVCGKSLILTTTNGTRAINLSLEADEILIGAMINARSVVEKLIELNKDVVFINAGTNGEFSMDDFICSGYMIYLLNKENNNDVTDIAKTAQMIYESNEDIVSYIKNARHYNVLKGLNLQEDLNYCCSKDIIKNVPKFDKKNNYIVLTEDKI